MKGRHDTLRFECPYCHDINRTQVINISYKKGNGTVVRRRQCLVCEQRYNTVECVIIGGGNRDGEIGKLFATVIKACTTTEAEVRLLKRKVMGI